MGSGNSPGSVDVKDQWEHLSGFRGTSCHKRVMVKLGFKKRALALLRREAISVGGVIALQWMRRMKLKMTNLEFFSSFFICSFSVGFTVGWMSSGERKQIVIHTVVPCPPVQDLG
ncbi:hypothetical protein Bca4012_063672 [Brassica carinata]